MNYHARCQMILGLPHTSRRRKPNARRQAHPAFRTGRTCHRLPSCFCWSRDASSRSRSTRRGRRVPSNRILDGSNWSGDAPVAVRKGNFYLRHASAPAAGGFRSVRRDESSSPLMKRQGVVEKRVKPTRRGRRVPRVQKLRCTSRRRAETTRSVSGQKSARDWDPCCHSLNGENIPPFHLHPRWTHIFP